MQAFVVEGRDMAALSITQRNLSVSQQYCSVASSRSRSTVSSVSYYCVATLALWVTMYINLFSICHPSWMDWYRTIFNHTPPS